MFTQLSDESCIIIAGSAGIEPDNSHDAVEIEEESRYYREVSPTLNRPQQEGLQHFNNLKWDLLNLVI